MKGEPFIVAEMGASHNGSFERALRIVDAAKSAGADAVKLQTYTPDSMVADRDYVLDSGPWVGRRLWELYDEAQTPLSWHAQLFNYCEHIGIECFSTPFDTKAVDFLEMMGCPRYKVASFEITDIPLIRCIGRTGKPMIISTGMANFDEIEEAVTTARRAGATRITLLKCTSSYPASADEANLITMFHMLDRLQCDIGVSDHTTGIAVPIAAAMMGAMVIEKHIRLDDQPGPDSGFSVSPTEFKQMVDEVRRAVNSIGEVRYGPTESELQSLRLRRSLYIVKDIRAGEILAKENVRPMRPALGIEPRHYDTILGRPVNTDIKAGVPLTWDVIGQCR